MPSTYHYNVLNFETVKNFNFLWELLLKKTTFLETPLGNNKKIKKQFVVFKRKGKTGQRGMGGVGQGQCDQMM